MANKKKARHAKGKQSQKATAETVDKVSFSPASIRQFVGEVKAEFNKVVWPERKVTVGLTGFVLILVTLISIYLGTVDLLLGKIVTMVLR